MSFGDKKGIVIASGFKLQAETMLDARQQVDTIQERDELVTIKAATPGLRVYVKATKKSYVYNGTGWDEITTGAAYIHPTGDGYHHVPATGTANNGKFLKSGSSAGSESWQNIKTSDIVDFPDSLPTKNNMIVKFNGGAQEGTNMFTFNGSEAKTVNITPAAIGAATSNHTHSPASIGAATADHDHTSDDITDFDDAVEALLPTIPTKLPNPQGLTISLNGTSQGAYDGSSAKSINITPDSIGASATGHTHNYAGSSSAGGAANSVKTSLIVKLNGGTTEGTNMFTFNGSAAKTVDITPSSIGAAASSHTHTHSNISDFDSAVKALLPSIPTKLPNPQVLTFTGAVSDTYDGSVAKTINIPTSAATKGDFVVQFNGGTTEDTDKFTFDGSEDKTINITPSAIGAAASTHTHNYAGSSSAGGAANSVKTSLIIKLNGGTTEGTNMFSFNGSAAKTVNITPDLIGAPTKSEMESAIQEASETLEESIPTKLPNPQGLTISLNGTSQGAYDGSSAKSINITPSSIGAATSNHTHSYAGSSSAGGAANSVKTSLIVKLNGGTTEGTDMFTFNGSAAKTVDITPSKIGAAASGHTHTHSNITDFDSAVKALLPSIPTKLPNPQALTFTGAVSDTYDGSTAKTINIPTSGSTDGNLVIQLNNGSSEGTNKFTFNGSDDKTINITPSSIGAATSSHTHNYAGSSSAGGAATSANKINGIELTNQDLNNYHSGVNFYYAAGSNGCANKPSGVDNFGMFVLQSAGGWWTQILYGSNDMIYTRHYNGSTWSSWSDVYSSINKPTPSEIGAAASSHTHNYAGSSSAGGAADSVKTSLIVKLNGGTTEGTNMFTFNGSAAKTVNITPASIGAAAASHGTHVSYGTDSPKANGTASAGSASTVSRSDHVHPLQTSVSGNAGSATKLATSRIIDGVSFNGTSNIIHYGECSTAAGTAAKVVSCTGFSLIAGAIITIKFTVTNTASNPTLNVNGTGAKSIMYRGSAITAGYLAANRVYTFVYDGTDYELIGDINTDSNTTYNTGTSTVAGLTKLYTGTGSASDGTMTQAAITNALNGKASSSHTHTASQISDFDDAVNELIPSIPTSLPNPQALTISLNGASQGAYTGSSAKSINITPSSIGAAASSHTHNYAGSSSAGGAANSVKTSLIVKLNGGTTEGTNMFTFNGSTEKTINITPLAIGAAAVSHGTHVSYGTDSPKANGTASAGSASTVSRSDHVHPLQTSVSGNAGSATKLATARIIDGVSFNGSANITHYGECSTAAGTAAKTVSLSGFSLITGALVSVKFTVTNTASNPTLNVNGTGAKSIMYRGSAITAGYLAANRIYTFVYDGTDYELIGDINTDTNTTYGTGSSSSAGLTKLYTGTGSASDGTMTQAAITNALNGKASSSHTHNYAGSSSAGGAANSVKTSLIVKLNGGTTEGTDMFTFNGSVAKTVDITPNLIGAADKNHGHSASQISGLTASRALVSNSSGQVAVANVTSTELGYLDGVTSSIQTQLNGKASSSHTHNYAGSSSAGGAANSAIKVAVPVGTILFSTSNSSTFFNSCFGGTWEIVGNVVANIDASSGSDSTLTLYMFKKTAL